MDAKLQSTRVASQWLQERLVELKRQAADADRALQDFKAANNLKSGRRRSQNAEMRANLNTQLTNAQIATAEAKSRLDRIRQRSGEEITTHDGHRCVEQPRQGRNDVTPASCFH